MFKSLKKAIAALENISMGVASLGLIGMLFGTVYEVVARYIFNSPTKWSFEISTYFLVLTAFLGGGYTLSKGGHIRVDVVTARLSYRIQSVLERISYIACIAFGILILLEGWDLMWYSFITKRLSPTPLHFPQFLPELCLPIGGILFIISCIGNLLDWGTDNSHARKKLWE